MTDKPTAVCGLSSPLNRRVDADLVVLDLRELEFIDCSGARELDALRTRVRRVGGRLLVVCSPGPADG